jgi:hypothetical protein
MPNVVGAIARAVQRKFGWSGVIGVAVSLLANAANLLVKGAGAIR